MISELESEHDAVFVYQGQLFTGKGVEYNAQGVKVWECTFLNGVEHGVERCWYHDGSLQSEQEFVHGEPHGVLHYWYETGQLRWEFQAEYGIYILEKQWSEQGELVLDWTIDESHFQYPKYLARKAEALGVR